MTFGISEQLIGLTEPYPLEEVETPCQSIVTRPWGHYRDLFRSTQYVLKTITVKPGAKLSLQYHIHRGEIWKVLKGQGRVYQEVPGMDHPGEGITMAALPGDLIEIGVGDIHRIENTGSVDLVILELQFGECSETDIVRIEDDWGRK